ncbi:MAG: rRNA maturation RNase YbeY [Rikenellaceae bacterium]
MKINFYTQNTDYKLKDKQKTRKTISYIIDNEGFILGNIDYIICPDADLLEINKQYLQHDYLTDVITFDYREEKLVSGDVFISFQTVEDNAREFNSTEQNEMLRVVIHGALHLCGYKDKSDGEAKIMREKENFYLDYFSKL